MDSTDRNPATSVCNVAVVDLTTYAVKKIAVGSHPNGVVVTPDGSKVYVTNADAASVSVISTATDKVIATIPVDVGPVGIVMAPDGATAWTVNQTSSYRT